jgi:hypothetical protein
MHINRILLHHVYVTSCLPQSMLRCSTFGYRTTDVVLWLQRALSLVSEGEIESCTLCTHNDLFIGRSTKTHCALSFSLPSCAHITLVLFIPPLFFLFIVIIYCLSPTPRGRLQDDLCPSYATQARTLALQILIYCNIAMAHSVLSVLQLPWAHIQSRV